MSKTHDRLVSFVAGKMQRFGFEIRFMEGNHVDVKVNKPELPGPIKTHRPDILGTKGEAIGIGEAKTKNDLKSTRTKTQLIDFRNLVRNNPQNRLFLCVPQTAEGELLRLLNQLGIDIDDQIDIMIIPDVLLFSNGEI